MQTCAPALDRSCVCYNQPPLKPTGSTNPPSSSDKNLEVKFMCDKLDPPCDDTGAIRKDSNRVS